LLLGRRRRPAAALAHARIRIGGQLQEGEKHDSSLALWVVTLTHTMEFLLLISSLVILTQTRDFSS
jgi:hypothetical protein